MARATLKVRPQNRAASFDLSSIDAEKRMVRLSFASPEPVKRYFGNEILGFGDGECDLSRLNNGAALLLNHDSDCQIGVVESAAINGERAYATVRFSSSPQGQEIFKDVQDGIRTKVSVGYNVNGAQLVSTDGDDSTYRITAWQPYEVSIVSVPADDSVGVGRGANQVETEIPLEIPEPMKRSQILLNPDPAAGGGGAPAPVIAVDPNQALSRRNQEVGEIMALGEKFNRPSAEIRSFVAGKTLEEYRSHVLAAIGVKPIDTSAAERDIPKEAGRYSLMRALRMASTGKFDGLEAEFHQEMAKQKRQEAPQGILVPDFVFNRSLTTTSLSAGGALVGTTVMPEVIQLLRNRPVIDKLGIRRLAGLTGNVAIPRATGGATAYWLPDSGTVTVGNATFGQVGLTPHKLVVATAYSKDLVAQSSVDVEGYARLDLGLVASIELDRAALLGLGTGGEPTGVANLTSRSTDVTFGAAATFAKFIEFETNVSANNALMGNPAYVISTATRGKLKQAAKIGSTFPVFVFDGQDSAFGDGTINGYRAIVTNQVGASAATANLAMFGNWDDLVLGTWSGIDIVVDPYSLVKQGQVQIVMTQWCDVASRHNKSFAISTDSAAQ